MERSTGYARWSKTALIQRIQSLEAEQARAQAKAAAAAPAGQQDGEQPEASSPAGPKDKNKKKRKARGTMDPTKYSTRLVAFKLAYVGRAFGGFEFQSDATLPAVEEELWKAFTTSCLILPETPEAVDWTDPRWQYSKCGRTDVGVSAFGQVIALRVRSNRPMPKTKEQEEAEAKTEAEAQAEAEAEAAADASGKSKKKKKNKPPRAPKHDWDDFTDELDYCRILNRLLPPDIRILAWCPTTPENFSARKDCRERQYRYYFTQPAFPPYPAAIEAPETSGGQGSRGVRSGWLDLAAMREAARKFEGYHDFRNFCKIDGSKQLTDFGRRIFESDVVEVPGAGTCVPFLTDEANQCGPLPGQNGVNLNKDDNNGGTGEQQFPQMYYFHVRGSAFLWHQIRCMVGVLFLVGQGLESPSVVDRLLDIEAQPRRPHYVLAEDSPLVLWDCIFPDLAAGEGVGGDYSNSGGGADDAHTKDDPSDPNATVAGVGERRFRDSLGWTWIGDEHPMDKHSPHGLVEGAWAQWRQRKIDETLYAQLLQLIGSRGEVSKRLDMASRTGGADNRSAGVPQTNSASCRVFEGGDGARNVGAYVEMSRKQTMYTPEEVNAREARRKGFASSEAMAEARREKGREKERRAEEELRRRTEAALGAVARVAERAAERRREGEGEGEVVVGSAEGVPGGGEGVGEGEGESEAMEE